MNAKDRLRVLAVILIGALIVLAGLVIIKAPPAGASKSCTGRTHYHDAKWHRHVNTGNEVQRLGAVFKVWKKQTWRPALGRYVTYDKTYAYCYDIDKAFAPEVEPPTQPEPPYYQASLAKDAEGAYAVSWYFTCQGDSRHRHYLAGKTHIWNRKDVFYRGGSKYVRGTWKTFDWGRERITASDTRTYGPC